MNHLHVAACFWNNYGRHMMAFNSKPTAFLWDWVGMSAPVAGAGCISINGELLAWTRWTEAGLQAAERVFEPVLGAPIAQMDQFVADDGL